MSNQSGLGMRKTDCRDMLERVINDNIVISHWQEKRVSDHVAQLSIAGCEDSSLPVLTFRATGFAKTFESPNTLKTLLLPIPLDSFTLEMCEETPISKTDRLPSS
jgi:hypothetical protein